MISLSGIDNYQLFPAIIVDNENNKQWDDFYIFNAVGLLDCAHADSVFDEIMPGSDEGMRAYGEYQKLIFDTEKTHGNRMFREVKSNDLYFHMKLFEIIKANKPSNGDSWGASVTGVEAR